ncbi:DUF4880 domain-containing protein [Sphingomonas gei]|uniref:DUF4880 domain-containing protein n=1 Tax=Sphingomonas gei TaxID=1395960 RepID=A0A4S1X1C5_9SPHN|nr:FecR domain-containing protein [Sphingomonas gei]TGX48737.1 DUF4880 domain-containing protein [Sphingomonas gei]
MTGSADAAGKGGFGADRERADREATDWLILLQDDPRNRELRARFEAWLHAAPDNAAAWAETRHVSSAIVATPPVHRAEWADLARAQSENLVDSQTARLRRGTRQAARRWGLGVSAAAAACVAIVAGPELLLVLSADATARAGEIRTVHLDDGSTVRLAAGGALKVDFAGGRRHVQLLRGNAFFDVAHDAAHPFRVSTGDAAVTVLGTAFEVRAEGDGAAVAVRRGQVKVDCSPGQRTAEFLTAGQAVKLDCKSTPRRSSIRPVRIAAWTQGQFIADDRSMRETIDAIRPWYRGLIIARGAELDRRRVTGIYDLRHPDQALGALAQAHQASVTRVMPWITIFSTN